MPQLDFSTYASQVFWLVVTFSVLFLLVWRVMAPKVTDVLEARQKRIGDNLDKAAEIKREAEATIETYEKTLSDARVESQSLIAAASAEIAEAAAKREAELAVTLAAQVTESETNIAKALEEAFENVRDAAVEVATAASELLLDKRLDDGDIDKSVDAALKMQD